MQFIQNKIVCPNTECKNHMQKYVETVHFKSYTNINAGNARIQDP
jgi:hypothetical protein